MVPINLKALTCKWQVTRLRRDNLVVSYDATKVAPALKDKLLLSSKKKPHFEMVFERTHFGHGSQEQLCSRSPAPVTACSSNHL
jgi:hypothetical protein